MLTLDEAPFEGGTAEERGVWRPEDEGAALIELMRAIGAPFDDDDVDQVFDLVWNAGRSREEAIEEWYRESAAAMLGAAGAPEESSDYFYRAPSDALDADELCSCHWPSEELVLRLRRASCDTRVSEPVQLGAALEANRLVAFGDFRAAMSAETRRLLIDALSALSRDRVASPETRRGAIEQAQRQRSLLRRSM